MCSRTAAFPPLFANNFGLSMIKPLFFLALLLLAAMSSDVAMAADTSAPTGTPTADAPALTAAQAQQALDVLQDPQKREQLIAVLQAIAKTRPAAQPAAQPQATAQAAPAPAASGADAPKISLKPDSLGAQLLVVLRQWGTKLAGDAMATLATMDSLPALGRWFVDLESDPQNSLLLLLAFAWLIGIFLCALLVELFSRWALRRPRDALLSRLPTANGEQMRLLRVLPYSVVRLGLDLVPIAAFAAVGNAMAAVAPHIGDHTRLVVVALVNAYAVCRAAMCVGRMLVSPDDRRLRLWRLDDDGARFVMVWLRRLVVLAIVGNALVEVALLLGLDESAHDGFERLISLVLAAMLIVVVIRSRRTVGPYIRGAGSSRWGAWLAEAWPYLAVITIVSFWIGMATGTRGGLSGLYFPGVAVAAIIAARLLTIVMLGVIERALRLNADAHDSLPGLSQRLTRYRLPLEYATTTIITLLCAVVILQLWGVPAFRWFTGDRIGDRLVSALLTILVAVVIAIAVWEVSQAVLERQLARPTADGHYRSVRLLTLMPLLRSALLATILTVVGLTALSEIGINIAPLLAGAGIAGVAIGFGAQRLVQDVITGIFVLFENAISIGDGVTAAGLSGTVEQLSVRTIRLRASDGAVHIIPFSSVTTITNNNRGLGNAPVSVSVAADEDSDRVAAVLTDIAAGMREDEEYASKMLGDLQLFGVDQVKTWGFTITGQIPCTDSGRWPVQREFNRRLKKRFQAENITLAGG
jgi:moderate conductance mechanosensitive channel